MYYLCRHLFLPWEYVDEHGAVFGDVYAAELEVTAAVRRLPGQVLHTDAPGDTPALRPSFPSACVRGII